MHHSQPGWIQQVKSDVLLVQRLLDAVKRGSLFGEQNADILIDLNSGTLVPELMVPGTAQSGFFLLESADQERAGGISGWFWKSGFGELSPGQEKQGKLPIMSIRTSEMNFMGSLPSSLPSGIFSIRRLALRERFSRSSHRSASDWFWV